MAIKKVKSPPQKSKILCDLAYSSFFMIEAVGYRAKTEGKALGVF